METQDETKMLCSEPCVPVHIGAKAIFGNAARDIPVWTLWGVRVLVAAGRSQSIAIGLAMVLWLPLTLASGQSGGGRSTDNVRCGVVYGTGHAFSVCAPKGWVLDNSILNDQGIYAAFYPEGSSWSKAKDDGTVMYVNTAAKGEGEDVGVIMKRDGEWARKNAPQVKIHAGKPISVRGGSPAFKSWSIQVSTDSKLLLISILRKCLSCSS